ncbi:MAG: DNA polymerase III subunit delta [Bacilli bacterium]
MKVYLIYSDSYKRINDKVNEIVNSSLNVIKYNLNNSTLKDVIEEANYFSLTGEEKYIIVKSNDYFSSKKSSEEKNDDLLLNYIDNPNKNTTIIFTSNVMFDKRKKIYKKINSFNNVIELIPYNKKELVYKCMEILKNYGYIINYETGNYIVENSYVNYDIMLSEIDKINLYFKKGNLSLEEIKKVVSNAISGTTYKYAKAIINQDLSLAFKMQKELEIFKIDPSLCILTLYKEMQIMLLIKQNNDIKNIQYLFGKENWQMDDYKINAQKYTIKEIKKIITKLCDYDYKYKSGLIDKSIILDLISLDLC